LYEVAAVGHTGDITNVVFSSDGKRVITASEDNTVRVWRFDWKSLLAYLKSTRRECLKPAQRMRFFGEPAAAAEERAHTCEANGSQH